MMKKINPRGKYNAYWYHTLDDYDELVKFDDIEQKLKGALSVIKTSILILAPQTRMIKLGETIYIGNAHHHERQSRDMCMLVLW